jgi:hypothetical protein
MRASSVPGTASDREADHEPPGCERPSGIAAVSAPGSTTQGFREFHEVDEFRPFAALI